MDDKNKKGQGKGRDDKGGEDTKPRAEDKSTISTPTDIKTLSIVKDFDKLSDPEKRNRIDEFKSISDKNHAKYKELQDEINVLGILFNNNMINHFDLTRIHRSSDIGHTGAALSSDDADKERDEVQWKVNIGVRPQSFRVGASVELLLKVETGDDDYVKTGFDKWQQATVTKINPFTVKTKVPSALHRPEVIIEGAVRHGNTVRLKVDKRKEGREPPSRWEWCFTCEEYKWHKLIEVGEQRRLDVDVARGLIFDQVIAGFGGMLLWDQHLDHLKKLQF